MSAGPIGARLRRVDAPSPDLLAVTLSSPTLRGALLIGLAGPTRGVGWVAQRPPGNTSSPLLLRARSCLEGGRLLEAHWVAPARLQLIVERAGQRHALEAWLGGTRGNVVLRGPGGELLAALHPHDAEAAGTAAAAAPAHVELDDVAALRAHGERMLDALGVNAVERQRLLLLRALRAAERRLERRLVAIEADRARVDRVHELRRHAGLLLTNLHALGDASGAVELRDEGVDPPVTVALQIDPALGPKRQAEAWFSTARKLERGAAMAVQRAQVTHAELAALRALSARAAAAQDTAQLDELLGASEAIGAAPDAADPAARKTRKVRLPYRQFKGSGARAIFVGKGAEDNDRLTLDHARPHDLWLHARDDAGAHVVVPLERGEACPAELLCDAATLAAHFSQARGQARVDVLYTERRYVRKPRKIGTGKVVLLREKVFRLHLQPERLKRLLAAER